MFHTHHKTPAAAAAALVQNPKNIDDAPVPRNALRAVR
jgi:hypothetical protein